MLSEPVLRPPSRGDLPAMQRLLLELGYDVDPTQLGRRVELLAAHSDHFLRVAVDADGEVLGAVHAFLLFDLTAGAATEIAVLVVGSRTRRGGVGRALVHAVEGWSAQRGVFRVQVRSQIHREGAHAFYRELGYVPVKQQTVLVREPKELRPRGPTTIVD
ncbi:MAG: GNAT family N-acetyltransferase [Nannocystaceae bacterium]